MSNGFKMCSDIAPYPSVRYCAETYERDPPRDDCQQTLDARYQGPRPLALARLTISPPALPDQYLYAFNLLFALHCTKRRSPALR
jgi:hypothetical protein